MIYSYNDYICSAEIIKKHIQKNFGYKKPSAGLILGSGLGFFAEKLRDSIKIPFEEIPNFRKPSALSHYGALIIGFYNEKLIICLQGRLHFYEGYSLEETTFPIRVLKLLDVDNIILTNASGGINDNLNVGDFMLVRDHIKFFDESPLRGKNIDEFGERFFDMSKVYDDKLADIALSCAKRINCNLKEGIYAYMPGPQYETPAEIRALKIMGADAVGMSTVPEVITAAQCGIKILCISCICNKAAGLGGILSGEEVIKTSESKKNDFTELLNEILKEI
ncbi:MAG: punA [Clostridia bacterium]|nr:punA [Clostridia bacterium]